MRRIPAITGIVLLQLQIAHAANDFAITVVLGEHSFKKSGSIGGIGSFDRF